jgi:hypothetical protein
MVAVCSLWTRGFFFLQFYGQTSTKILSKFDYRSES